MAKAKAKKASAKQSINSGAISKASGEERHISKRDSSEAAEVSKNESISTPSNKEETASQEHGSQNHHPQKESTVNSNGGGDVKSAADAKKARIAAAVAKAKAKKAAIDKEKELK